MTNNTLLRNLRHAAIALLAAFMLVSLSSCVTSLPYYGPGYEYYYNGRYYKKPPHQKRHKHKHKPPKPQKPHKPHKPQKPNKPHKPSKPGKRGSNRGYGNGYRGAGEHR